MLAKFALIPLLNKGKSFSGNAVVWVDTHHSTHLRLESYGLPVCNVYINSQTQRAEALIQCERFEDKYVNTRTTRKHVKEFLYQCFSYYFVEHFNDIIKEFNKQSGLIKIENFSDFLQVIAEVSCDYKSGHIVYTFTDYRGCKVAISVENEYA